MTKTKYSVALICCICAVMSIATFSSMAVPSDWSIKKSESGVRLYIAKDEQGQRWVKAHTLVEAPWWSLLNALRETDKGPEWIDNALDVSLLEQPDQYTDIVRTRFSAPLWFENREMVTQSIVSFDHQNQVLTIEVKQQVQQHASDGYTQMENVEGVWQVKALEGNLSQITWTGTGVAGGGIPDWLAANVMVGSTFRTFQALKTRLSQEKYHHKPLGYILSSKNRPN